MKKAVCILSALAFAFGAVSAGAEEGARVELLNPRRVNLYCPDGYDGKNLMINNELVFDDDGNTIGRTIINEAEGSQNGGALRFKGTYIYGSRRWKNSFTYEFDFRVDTISNQFIMKIGSAAIRFAKDTQPNQYFIVWENDNTAGGISHPLGTIWAHPAGGLLQLGQTYHLRIEADMADGGKVFVTCSDPETGYSHTSFKAHGANNSQETYVTTDKVYGFTLSCIGPVSITTTNEEMYYETFFLLSHGLQAEPGSSEIKASASVMNTTNDKLTEVPYLFLGVYDENGAMVKYTGKYDGEVNRQDNADNLLLTARYDYSVNLDISGLEDGTYTAKSFIWRSPDEMIVGAQAKESVFRIENGAVAGETAEESFEETEAASPAAAEVISSAEDEDVSLEAEKNTNGE